MPSRISTYSFTGYSHRGQSVFFHFGDFMFSEDSGFAHLPDGIDGLEDDPWEVEWRETYTDENWWNETWWEDFQWTDLGNDWYAWEGVMPSYSFAPKPQCNN